ncbi:hypothetical protein GCM10009741_77600 [Kribbella lupini]|uniref:Uncharacterized protein n=1 Tax=Kribbella lupini TaxID=291602 RepID=A0ABN2CLW3_9ACTN
MGAGAAVEVVAAMAGTARAAAATAVSAEIKRRDIGASLPIGAECDQPTTDRNATDRDTAATNPHQDGENPGVNLRYPRVALRSLPR